MEETGEPAGFVSAVITGSAFGFVSYFLSEGLRLTTVGGGFEMEELVILGALFGVALHVFGKIRAGRSLRADE